MDTMARTLDQIIAELNPTYQAQTDSLAAQADLIPQQVQQQQQGLDAKKDQAFGDILNGARQRGLGFSGIPLAEQAKYASTDYAPALVNLQQQGTQRAQSLQDAILGINERRDTLAQTIQGQERDRDFQAQQAELARQFQAQQDAASRAASAASAFSPSYGGYDAPTQAAPAQKPLLRDILQDQAKRGNYESQILLNYVGNDGRYDGAVKSQQEYDIMKRAGVKGNFYFNKPAQAATGQAYNPNSGYTGGTLKLGAR